MGQIASSMNLGLKSGGGGGKEVKNFGMGSREMHNNSRGDRGPQI